MADTNKVKTGREADVLPNPSTGALVFVSHDSRDAELAEAFSELLKSVSAGMLKCFRSSDKKGTEGFQFGDEWYNRLMDKLQAASDVVCLPMIARRMAHHGFLWSTRQAQTRLHEEPCQLPLLSQRIAAVIGKWSEG